MTNDLVRYATRGANVPRSIQREIARAECNGIVEAHETRVFGGVVRVAMYTRADVGSVAAELTRRDPAGQADYDALLATTTSILAARLMQFGMR
jgi:hypothetical protein